MKALVYNKFGGPEVLDTTSIDIPAFNNTTAVVRIHTVSLNPRDTSLRRGEFKFLTGSKFPKLTGADFSGTIEGVGQNPEGFKKGDEVFGYIQDLNTAVCAEFAAIPIKYLAKKRSTITHQKASTLGCAYLTALQALRDKIKVQRMDRLVIYGAAGGVGTAAMQLARHFGAHVIAVSHSANRQYCFDQGADDFVSYDEQDIFSISKDIDAFFQVYSKEGSVYHRAKNILVENGRFVCLIPNPLFLFRKLFSKPSFNYMLVKSNVKDLELLADLTERKVVDPQITRAYTMDEARNAYKFLEDGRVQGKVVLNVLNSSQ